MTTLRLDDVEEIFFAAREVPPGRERSCYLEVACGGDDALLREVHSLLENDEGPETLLDRPAALNALLGAVRAPAAEGVGSVIGPYTLTRRIGAGGMGEVFEADQYKPIERKVALKIIQSNDSGEGVSDAFVRRFEIERTALSRLDHDNITRVLDAGLAPSRRPYLVMELVEGQSLVKYCDSLSLSIDERLGLFVDVCSAIHHAHQKGIIHRDIKPSNLLVTQANGKARLKVIDFGIAKLVDLVERESLEEPLTRHAEIVGTPQYMSPEQAGASDGQVDTRSDVYSLGVVLYVLLVGTTPLVGVRSVFEACEKVRSQPAERLSSRAQQMTESQCAARSISLERLRKMLGGELELIVSKALSLDIEQRYDSAAALASDISSFRNSEPIQARRPSLGYTISKLARKHRSVATMLGVGVTAIIAAAVVSIVFAIQANRARDLANLRTAELVEQKERAERLRVVAEENLSRANRAEEAGENRQRRDANELAILRVIDEYKTAGGTTLSSAMRNTELKVDVRIEPGDGMVTADPTEVFDSLVPMRTSDVLALATEINQKPLAGPERVALLKFILREQENVLAASDPYIADTLALLARAHSEAGEAAASRRATRRCETIRKQHLIEVSDHSCRVKDTPKTRRQ